MENSVFSPMEIDAIGEIMNISLGSSATAVSNMLDHRVDITTPKVTVIDAKEFDLGNLEPAVGVEIRYVSGLEGSNIMLLKRSDVKMIVDILMGSETPDDEFEFNELTISAVCEVMNQMMGAASTALSDFLGRLVNISTPQSFELDNFDAFKAEHFPSDAGNIVVVKFELGIEDSLRSEFINVMSVNLARELIQGFGLEGETVTLPAETAAPAGGGTLSQAEIERLMGGGAPAPAPASGGSLSQEEIERLMGGGAAQSAPAPAPAVPSGKMSQEDIERLMGGMPDPAANAAPQPQAAPPQQSAPAYPPQEQAAPAYPGYPYPMAPGAYPPYPQAVPGGYPPPYAGYYPSPETNREPPAPKVINTQSVAMPQLEVAERLAPEQAKNLDLIMSVPLEVSVEIGRTHKKVQDILTFAKGSLVVLDKLAGDQVDLFVNGQCIARGDVVVIDDNFGIRITEILKNPDLTGLSFS